MVLYINGLSNKKVIFQESELKLPLLSISPVGKYCVSMALKMWEPYLSTLNYRVVEKKSYKTVSISP